MEEVCQTILAADGKSLALYQWRPPAAVSIAGILQIVHGMAEHAERYQELGNFLSTKGYLVVAHNHRGHGRSCEELGHFADHQGWQLVLSDIQAVARHLQGQYPQSPFFMLGHSMGSFLVQQYMINQGGNLAGTILSGSNYAPPLKMQLARVVPWLESKRIGPRGQSPLVHKLTFATFNAAFKPNRTAFDWLSRDMAAVDLYAADKACGFRCSNQLWMDMLAGLAEVCKARKQALIPKNLPVYIIGGANDPVSRGGGLTRLYQSLKKAGLQDVSCEIFPDCRHELFHELNRQEVFKKLANWLESHS